MSVRSGTFPTHPRGFDLAVPQPIRGASCGLAKPRRQLWCIWHVPGPVLCRHKGKMRVMTGFKRSFLFSCLPFRLSDSVRWSWLPEIPSPSRRAGATLSPVAPNQDVPERRCCHGHEWNRLGNLKGRPSRDSSFFLVVGLGQKHVVMWYCSNVGRTKSLKKSLYV